MKQRIILAFVACLCFSRGFAASIQVSELSLKPGETKDLNISLSPAVSGMAGLQFDIKLPEGFSLESMGGNVYQMSTSQSSDIACNVSNLDGNTFRFVIYSASLQSLKSGELMSLNLKADDNKALGNYTISIDNIAFSDADGRVTKENGASANVTVTLPFTPGDVNDDGVIDKKDIDSVVSYMLDDIPSPFVFEAADMNGDNKISAIDLGYIINLTMAK